MREKGAEKDLSERLTTVKYRPDYAKSLTRGFVWGVVKVLRDASQKYGW